MKILIPTAKEMNTNIQVFENIETPKSVLKIATEFAKQDMKTLSKIYKIKEKQAEIEKGRWQGILKKTEKHYEALNLFDGLMYRNIKRKDLSEKEYKYIKNNVFITSALYGIINVCEKISEHRLDFQTSVQIDGKGLKEYWRSSYDSFVEENQMQKELFISLLSSEFEDVFSKKIRENFVKIEFFEEVDKILKKHSTISKKGRGKLLSQLIVKQIETLDEIKKIKFDDFVYREDLSSEKNLVFVAKK